MLSVPQFPHLLNEDSNGISSNCYRQVKSALNCPGTKKKVLNAGFSYLNFPKFEVHLFNYEPRT